MILGKSGLTKPTQPTEIKKTQNSNKIDLNKTTIRLAENEKEVRMVMDWANNEGWNVGKFDAIAYFKTFPQGLKLLIHDNKPIGAIFVAHYGNNFSFIGMFLVLPEYRKQGCGEKLWATAMTEIKNCGLHSVPQQISRYQKSDFKGYDSTQRWVLETGSLKIGNLENKDDVLALSKDNSSLLECMEKYDTTLFPSPRFSLIKNMLAMQNTAGFVVKDNKKNIIGYGIIRPCEKGYRIGPLYANNCEGAKILNHKLIEIAAKTKDQVFFDAPSPERNKYILMFADFFNFKRNDKGDTELMYKGNPPKEVTENFEKTYSVATLEMG